MMDFDSISDGFIHNCKLVNHHHSTHPVPNMESSFLCHGAARCLKRKNVVIYRLLEALCILGTVQ